MIIFLACLCALGTLALIAQTFVFKWLFNRGHEANKGLADELEHLQREIIDIKHARDRWHKNTQGLIDERRTTWHAHQIVKKGKQVICLTAIVEASDGPGAVAAFEAQMKEVKAKMRIRSKAPVFAKPVFPNI